MKLTNANWLIKKKEGLYCIPGDFYIDPLYPVKKALITHAHTDHARPNNHLILGTKQTIEIMKIRYAKNYCTNYQVINYNSPLTINNIDITFIPAGHILGSSQILIEYNGYKVLISGDYKRVEDKTCKGYQNKKCDTFVTEATFGLPIFSHPSDKAEIRKILESVKYNLHSSDKDISRYVKMHVDDGLERLYELNANKKLNETYELFQGLIS